MSVSKDKNLILKLVRHTYERMARINQIIKKSLKFELYDCNKEIIMLKALCHISKMVSAEDNNTNKNVFIGQCYLDFIKESRGSFRHPVANYNYVIVPHIKRWF
jgi:hypothetical protein